MERINISSARSDIYSLIGNVAKTGSPICVTSKSGNVVVVSEDEWRDIEETIYIMSNKATYEAIKEGMKTPISECVEDVEW